MIFTKMEIIMISPISVKEYKDFPLTFMFLVIQLNRYDFPLLFIFVEINSNHNIYYINSYTISFYHCFC
jgi:hypothetical protein